MSRRRKGVCAPTHRGGQSNVARVIGTQVHAVEVARSIERDNCVWYRSCWDRAVKANETSVCPAVCAMYKPKDES